MKLLTVLLALLIVGCSPSQVLVERVIDGDTIVLEDGRHIRYLDIDTPEVGEVGSAEATAKNRELVEGKVVILEGKAKDKYGRLLCYVYVDGIQVNAELLRLGLARAWP